MNIEQIPGDQKVSLSKNTESAKYLHCFNTHDFLVLNHKILYCTFILGNKLLKLMFFTRSPLIYGSREQPSQGNL